MKHFCLDYGYNSTRLGHSTGLTKGVMHENTIIASITLLDHGALCGIRVESIKRRYAGD